MNWLESAFRLNGRCGLQFQNELNRPWCTNRGKKELIRQIRALERAPRESAKVFDRAEAFSAEKQAAACDKSNPPPNEVAMGNTPFIQDDIFHHRQKLPVPVPWCRPVLQAPCHGLLEEMSMAELKERLKVMQAQHDRRRSDSLKGQVSEIGFKKGIPIVASH